MSAGSSANASRATSGPPLHDSDTNLNCVQLLARVGLFTQIRQGQAKAEDLLPDNVLSQSLRSLILTKETQYTSHHEDHSALSNAAITSGVHGRSNDQELWRSGGCCANVAAADYAPPGILHQFIKHVKPFSLCLDDSARESNMAAGLDATSGTMSVDRFEDDDYVGSISENHGHSRAAETPRRHDTRDAGMLSAGGRSTEDSIASARRVAEYAGETQQNGGGRQNGAVGVPRKPKVPKGEGGDVCRANTSLKGKRKLAYSSPTASDDGGRLGSTGLAGGAAVKNAGGATSMTVMAGAASQGKSFDSGQGGWCRLLVLTRPRSLIGICVLYTDVVSYTRNSCPIYGICVLYKKFIFEHGSLPWR